jgi:hypothetical protein
MLADRPEEEVAALYEDYELVTPTGRRLENLEALMRILREARRRGYAENIDETSVGLHCLAAPVGPPGRVVAAITLCVPTGRMSAARKRQMLPDLLRAAREIVPRSGDTGHGTPDGVPGAPEGVPGAPDGVPGAPDGLPRTPDGVHSALDGEPAPPAKAILNQSNKLTTRGASIPRHGGRRRPDPNRKVAP